MSTNTSKPTTGASTTAHPDDHLDSYIEALRSDLRAKKAEIIASGMNFNNAESAKFWPVYRQYETEVAKLNDQRIALLNDYAEHYDSMTPDKAKELMTKSFDLDKKQVDLKQQYVKKFEGVLPADRVAKFFQIDNRLDLLMNVKIASELPIIK
jgi:hypothetical protein